MRQQRHKDLKKECDLLWSETIKARAGYKSELSGKTERLNSHHLKGKNSYALRYSLENGFCCTSGEHNFGFHNTERRASFEERVKRLRGADIFERLEKLKWCKSKVDLGMIKAYLKQELGKFKPVAGKSDRWAGTV